MKKSTLIVAIFLSLFLFLFIAHKINLPAADIGRHIKNGEIFLNADQYDISRSALLHTNFFSYTYPDFPFINHHWGSGILAYLIYSIFGWSGLSLAYISTIIGAFFILFLLVSKKTPLYANIPLSLFLIPLIAERTEVRPEGLSYLFIAIFLYVLIQFADNKFTKKYLYALPILTILWVNLHIYAVFAPLLIGAFFCESLFRKDWGKVKILFLCMTVSAGALLISPYGLEGAMYPFKIFSNYGYLVAENQSILFLEKLNFINPNFLWWKLSAFLTFILSGFTLFYNTKRFPLALCLIVLAFGGLSFAGIRHLSAFGLVLLPFLGALFALLCEKINTEEKKQEFWIWSVIFSFFLIVIIWVHFGNRLPTNESWGLGLLPHNTDSVSFVQKTLIKGPFFSNYDIGGFIIFNLFTPNNQEKVFVDNRPEAYPKDFFPNTYIPMQENSELWKNKSEQYNFNAIWFYRLDMTPWSQAFLIERIQDPLWAAVFVDDYTIIFLKRNTQNREIIEQFELPKNMFSVRG